jgi:amino acid adenylation domain-containing protein
MSGPDTRGRGLDARRSELLARLAAELGLNEALPAISLTGREERRVRASFGQERTWFLNQLEGKIPFQSITKAIRLEGIVNLAALESTFAELVRRHESLRTRFEVSDGVLFQIVCPPWQPTCEVQDLAVVLDSTEREREASRLITQEAVQEFDLARGGLLRVTLLRLGEMHHILVLTVHHIIVDGWSIGILVQEFSALYSSFASGSLGQLAPLTAQFTDFALWEQRTLDEDTLTQQLAYWRQRLGGTLTALNLPTSRPRLSRRSFEGAEVPVQIGLPVQHALRASCRRLGVTAYEYLLATFALLLYRYTDQNDILIGSPFANRSRREFEPIIGLLANTVVLRVDIAPRMNFAELVGHVRDLVRGAMAHQEVPFEKVVQAVNPDRVAGATPAFCVWFALQNWPMPALSLPGLQISPVKLPTRTAEFELTLDLWRSERSLSGHLEYSRELFTEQSAEGVSRHFCNALRSSCSGPEDRIKDLAILDEGERRAMIFLGARKTNEPLFRLPVHRLFEAQVDQSPDRIAVMAGDATLTFAELDRAANKLAHQLRRSGIGPDCVVAILLPPGLDFAVALLAVLKASGAFLPLDLSAPANRLSGMLENCDARTLITNKQFSGRLTSVGTATILTLDRPSSETNDATQRLSAEAPVEALAYVMYTSGSTGCPKGVAVTHRALACYLDSVTEAFGLTNEDRILQFAPVGFDVVVEELFPAWLRGGAVVFRSDEGPLEPSQLLSLIKQHGVTVVEVPNLYWQLLADAIELFGPPHSLRLVLVGCGTVSLQGLQRWKRLGIGLAHVYGLTEATVTSTVCDSAWWDDSEHPWPRMPIGRPLAGVHLYVLDNRAAPVPSGVTGDIYIGGDTLARGYVGAPADTAEHFLPDPFRGLPGARMFRTGDRGRWLQDGTLDFLGRLDDQVKVRGYRVELKEIELQLTQHADVREAVVTVREKGDGDNQLVGFVVPNAGCSFDGRALQRFLKGSLPPYLCPSTLIELSALPQTPQGKVDKLALALIGTPPVADCCLDPAQGAEEMAIAGIWCSLLGVDSVSRRDNFFELGGHSLLATQLAFRLSKVFGVELPVRMIFEVPTLSELASVLATCAKTSYAPIGRRNRAHPAPLSFSQERLWFLHQLDPYSAAYNVPASVRLEGLLDVEALRTALDRLVERHEILRASFSELDGQPVQVAHPPVPLMLDTIEVVSAHVPDSEATALDLARADSARPFDLSCGPLIRVTLLRLGAERHILLLTMHHIVADARSLEILLDELADLYEAAVQGRPSLLRPPAIQFADYAAWQRENVKTEQLTAQLAYWKQRLAEFTAGTELPTDRHRTPAQTFRGATLGFQIPRTTAASIRALARDSGVTISTALLACFQTLLYRYTADRTITVGVPLANRTRPEVEGVVGFFVNTVVILSGFDGRPTFSDLLRRVHVAMVEAQANQDVPFEAVVEALRPTRDLSRHPLFQTMFSFDRVTPQRRRICNLSIEAYGVHTGAAQFDLTLDISDSAESMAGTFCYAVDLFEVSTIERLASHFQHLLELVTANPDCRIDSLSLSDDQERFQILHEWNATRRARDPSLTLGRLFSDAAARNAQAFAVITPHGSLTYAELEAAAREVACQLRTLGVGPEVVTALAVSNNIWLAVGILGILLAGAAFLPIDPSLPEDRFTFLLTNASARVVVTEPRFRERVAAHADGAMIFELGRNRIRERDSTSPQRAFGKSLAYVTYTSGSTGIPRPVALSHETLVNFVLDMAERTGITSQDRFLQFAPLSFDVLLEELFPVWSSGAAVILDERIAAPSPTELLRTIREHSITMMELPTVYWEQLVHGLARTGDVPLPLPPSLRLVLLGCDPPSGAAVSAWRSTKVPLLHVFGLTETSVTSTTHAIRIDAPAPATNVSLPIGRPTANTTTYLLDAALEPVPFGAVGQLFIGGHGLARGYLDQPAFTADRFIPDPFSSEPGMRLYRTGDRARFNATGELQFLGRLDQQVKIRGFRIELGEVEACLRAHPTVCGVAAAPREGPSGTQLFAFVTLFSRSSGTPDLRDWVRGRIPGYMVPSRIIVTESLPYTPSGKIDRTALMSWSEGPSSPADSTGSDAASVLALLWREVLGVSSLTPDDNFFDLGGDSMASIVIASRARSAGLEISPRDIFRHQTLAELSQVVRVCEDPPAMARKRFARSKLSDEEIGRFLSMVTISD